MPFPNTHLQYFLVAELYFMCGYTVTYGIPLWWTLRPFHVIFVFLSPCCISLIPTFSENILLPPPPSSQEELSP